MNHSIRDPRIPAHVPAELVFDYDILADPARFEAPHFSVPEMLRPAPPIFFSPLNGGHWVIRRAEDMREMYRQPEYFSSDPQYNYQKAGNPTRHLPNYYDPPEHAQARQIFAPMFSPAAVSRMEPGLRSLAGELIEAVYARGECEFVAEIGHRFPTTVFLRLADGPLDQREAMVDMAARYLRGTTPSAQHAALGELAGILAALLERRKQNLADDLISRILKAQFLGGPLTHEQALGAAVFMFLAGLDTVAATMSFAIRFLARNPAHYRQLVEDPTRIPLAVEELIRISGVAAPERGVRQDVSYKGIAFRQGDRIVFLNQLSGMDPAEQDNPTTVDFSRTVSHHMVFGSGPHRCIGSHLARLEIRIFLEEWVKRIPAFSVKPETVVKVNGGIAWIPAALPLVWAVEGVGRSG